MVDVYYDILAALLYGSSFFFLFFFFLFYFFIFFIFLRKIMSDDGIFLSKLAETETFHGPQLMVLCTISHQ
jgi:hypothetical protein